MNTQRTRMLAPIRTLTLGISMPAAAGELYGKILEGATAIGDTGTVEIKCGAKTYPPVKTDKTGSYHLAVVESAKCTLTVKVKDRAASLDVVSYDEPVQLDLILETKDGKLALRRK
jgi:hypothetical protein